MFKKTNRLTQSAFTEFFAVGKRHHGKYMTIITSSHPTLKTAVVVGKKVAKSAVKRNTLRRRVYATLHEQVTSKQYVGVVIVLVKPTFASLPRITAQDACATAVAQALKSA